MHRGSRHVQAGHWQHRLESGICKSPATTSISPVVKPFVGRRELPHTRCHHNRKRILRRISHPPHYKAPRMPPPFPNKYKKSQVKTEKDCWTCRKTTFTCLRGSWLDPSAQKSRACSFSTSALPALRILQLRTIMPAEATSSTPATRISKTATSLLPSSRPHHQWPRRRKADRHRLKSTKP